MSIRVSVSKETWMDIFTWLVLCTVVSGLAVVISSALKRHSKGDGDVGFDYQSLESYDYGPDSGSCDSGGDSGCSGD